MNDLTGFKRGEPRNEVLPTSSFASRPLDGAFGIEISGIDLSERVTDRVADDIRTNFARHRLLVIRDQHLEPDDLLRFCRLFGDIGSYPFAESLPDHPGVVPIQSDGKAERNFGGIWHLDSPYFEIPPVATALFALEVPDFGGDTVFADLCAAYRALSFGMQRMLSGLRAVYTAQAVHGREASDVKLGTVRRVRNLETAEREVIRSIVDTHPVTHEPILSISRFHLSRFENMTEQESAPLLDYLASHAVHPLFTSRVRWRAGTVLLLDNRCVLHMGLNDYPGARRVLHRVVINPAKS